MNFLMMKKKNIFDKLLRHLIVMGMAILETKQILNNFKWIEFLFYFSKFMIKRFDKSLTHYNSLSNHHKHLIPDYMTNFDKIYQLVDVNHNVIQLILKSVDHMFANQDLSGQLVYALINTNLFLNISLYFIKLNSNLNRMKEKGYCNHLIWTV